MSTSNSSIASHKPKKRATLRAKAARAPSASEIARNAGHFETWRSHQGCEQVSYADLPAELKPDIDQVFNVTSKLPLAWTDKESAEHQALAQYAGSNFLGFIEKAYQACPGLFGQGSQDEEADHLTDLYSELVPICSAWGRLKKMRQSVEKWSEADFVGNVYNPVRSHAIAESTHRIHCTISLPQPIRKVDNDAVRVLNAKTVIPDCSIFIPAGRIQTLSHSAKAPYKVLQRHSTVAKSGKASKQTSFRYQATPCAQLPEAPGFEFVSTIFEDKKPTHQMLEDAYRQNRMATTAASRHLHSLRIQAPVFGLVWANGTVRAHVDWCKTEEGKRTTVYSAPYPGAAEDSENFHEWTLDEPSDMLKVYFLVRNIDRWTAGQFCQRVIDGVRTSVQAVVEEKKEYKPWKRFGELAVLSDTRKENIAVSISSSSFSSEPKPRSRKHRC
ncbi:hypothetical protein HGRIS_008102 [Hohenbuehelia grisea]|uniref:Uncharacterized protein n=1 Tax=Hohenbuehelia grisea TaxID=104357 RepID=A0ABR3J6Y4_9AGAR